MSYETPDSHADIEHRLSHHAPPDADRIAQHEAVRAAVKRLSHALDRIVPPGRHKAMAQTFVEQAMWAANAAVACHVPPPPSPSIADPGVPLSELLPNVKTFTVPDEPQTVHVVPTPPDLIEHVTDNGPVCPCNPRIEPQHGGGLVIVHNAADGRV